jgi:hypothetical protein
MDSKNVIVWQKWVDPFGQEEDETEFDPYVGEYFDAEETFNDENNEEMPSEKEIINMNKKAIRVIATPMGIIPVNDNTLSGKLFNFWVGHTNFNITPTVAELIETTNGVETLDIFTRYRFRISVGKAFDDSEVMRNINTIVYDELTNAPS